MSIERELKEVLENLYKIAFTDGRNNIPRPIAFIENEVDTVLLPIIAKWHKEQCKNCKRLDRTGGYHDVDEFYKE